MSLLSGRERHLLRFLGHSALLSAHVPANVSGICGLCDDSLERCPDLPGNWRSALVRKLSIDSGGQLGDGALDEGALSSTRAEEDGVDDDKDPRALLEE